MQQSRTKLFLIELIIIMLFFAFAGAACMNLFANAKILSTNSTQLTHAYLKAQNTAETIKAVKDVDEVVALLNATKTSEGFKIYYDENWANSKEGDYKLNTQITKDKDMLSANISVLDKDNVIYNISTKIFVGESELK